MHRVHPWFHPTKRLHENVTVATSMFLGNGPSTARARSASHRARPGRPWSLHARVADMYGPLHAEHVTASTQQPCRLLVLRGASVRSTRGMYICMSRVDRTHSSEHTAIEVPALGLVCLYKTVLGIYASDHMLASRPATSLLMPDGAQTPLTSQFSLRLSSSRARPAASPRSASPRTARAGRAGERTNGWAGRTLPGS